MTLYETCVEIIEFAENILSIFFQDYKTLKLDELKLPLRDFFTLGIDLKLEYYKMRFKF